MSTLTPVPAGPTLGLADDCMDIPTPLSETRRNHYLGPGRPVPRRVTMASR